jgi:hypothetical protein
MKKKIVLYIIVLLISCLCYYLFLRPEIIDTVTDHAKFPNKMLYLEITFFFFYGMALYAIFLIGFDFSYLGLSKENRELMKKLENIENIKTTDEEQEYGMKNTSRMILSFLFLIVTAYFSFINYRLIFKRSFFDAVSTENGLYSIYAIFSKLLLLAVIGIFTFFIMIALSGTLIFLGEKLRQRLNKR